MALAIPTNPASSADCTRLHITPLNSTLLQAILPLSLLPAARNISYHSLQTFPEKGFGFVDLPAMEAEKLKKKLNGKILKGTKLKIEEARPPKGLPDNDETLPTPKIKEKVKKRKRDTDTLAGIELQDRKVKRGWTEPAASKKSGKESKVKNIKKESARSKYTSGPECLFRTTLPANIAASKDDFVTASDSKSERRSRSKSAKNTIIHEFSKTMKHATFLRSKKASESKTVSKYVEDKGWVDSAGNVVEPGPTRKRKGNFAIKQDSENSSESSQGGEVSEASSVDEEITSNVQQKASKKAAVEDSPTSSSGTLEWKDGSRVEDGTQSKQENDKSQRPMSSSGTPIGLLIEIPKVAASKSVSTPVHPLEALFKRRRPDAKNPKVSEPLPKFSFFGNDVDSEDANVLAESMPMTPFTLQDFAHRGIRSAAPTPDTAHPGKTYTRWPTDTDIHEGDREDGGEDNAHELSYSPSHKQKTVGKKQGTNSGAATAPEIEFQKWFYEHRGEATRAWKKRRKMAAKEKRHRENKKGGKAA